MLRRTIIVIAILAAAAVSAWAAESGVRFETITAEDLKAEMESGRSKVFLVDARGSEEYREGHLPGAINVPPHNLYALAGVLPMDKGIPLVFYCRGYNCTLSYSAAMEAYKIGYANIRVFRGGFPEWSAKGYKVVR